MFETNIFSAKSYLTTDTVKVRDDGETFVKSGNDWISSSGNLIQKTSNGFLNLQTGINSTFGDPFGDDDDN